MRWVCPHCTSALETPELTAEADVPGPQPGWAYARCFACQSFAAVELATAHALPIGAPVTVVPQAPEPAAERAPEPVAATPPPFTELAPLSGTLQDIIETEPPRRVAGAWLAAFAASVIGAAGMTAWLVARASSRVPKTEVKRLAALEPSPAQERAHAAAQRMEGTNVNDSIHSEAMAPVRPDTNAGLASHGELFLQARKSARSLELRSGPGYGFPLFGLGDLEERYPVVEWKNRWFKIQLEETPGLTAWVPYERVELFSTDKEVNE